MSADRVSLAQQEDQLRGHLSTIRHGWDQMHQPAVSRSYVPYGGHGGSTSTPKAADNSDDNHDVSSLDALVSDRAHITLILNGWSRVIMEDYDVTTVLPSGLDAKAMCTFIDRWARHLTGHDAFSDLLDEIADCASRVRRWTTPKGSREWTWIGDCPVTIGHDGDRVTCGTPIRVYPHQAIRCRGCGTDDTLDGWVLRIVGHHEPVTAEQLVPLLHARLGIVVTRVAIRQWAKRGVIVSSGVDSQGRALFDRADVFTRLAYRDRRGA